MGRQLELRIEFPNHMICIYIYKYSYIHIYFSFHSLMILNGAFQHHPFFGWLSPCELPGELGFWKLIFPQNMAKEGPPSYWSWFITFISPSKYIVLSIIHYCYGAPSWVYVNILKTNHPLNAEDRFPGCLEAALIGSPQCQLRWEGEPSQMGSSRNRDITYHISMQVYIYICM